MVRRIFAEAAAGRPIRSIARGLTEEGIPTPAGQLLPWATGTVWSMLHNTAYVGRLLASGPGKIAPEAAAAMLPCRLLTASPFPRARSRPSSTTTHSNPSRAGWRPIKPRPRGTISIRRTPSCAAASPAAGTAAITCNVTRNPRSPYYSYRCNSNNRYRHGCPSFTLPAPALDAAVWAKVRATILDDDLIAREVQKLHNQDPTEADIAALDLRVAEVLRRRSNLTKRLALFDDDDAAAPLIAEIAMLTKEHRQHEADRAALLAERESWQTTQAQLAAITNWRRTVAENLDTLDYAGKRNALEALGIEARVYAKQHEPRYDIRASIALKDSIVSCSPRTPGVPARGRSVSSSPVGPRCVSPAS